MAMSSQPADGDGEPQPERSVEAADRDAAVQARATRQAAREEMLRRIVAEDRRLLARLAR